MTYIIIFLAGVFAGVINTLAGGGSLLTLPLLIFMGLPPSIANGTNRIAIWIQCVSAVRGFQKQGVSHFRMSWFLSIPAIIGAIIGAQFSIKLSDETFQHIIAIIMLAVIGLVVWNPKPGEMPERQSTWLHTISVTIVFFGIGFYGGFIQAGVGYFLTACLVLLCGFNLVSTAAVKSFIIAVYTTFACIIFIWNDQVNWTFALVQSLGTMIGAHIASYLAIEKGDAWIRYILMVAVVAMALKMFGIFSFL